MRLTEAQRRQMGARQEFIDRFYFERGPCCAGCDHWRSVSAVVGECRRSAPVSSVERMAMLEIERSSLLPSAGHVMTPREHVCGEFRDDFDWPTLPLPYLKRIGYRLDRPNGTATKRRA